MWHSPRRARLALCLAWVVCLGGSAGTGTPAIVSQSAEQGGLPAAYARAERLLPWNVPALAPNLEIEPHWIDGEADTFWYRRDSPDGWEYRVVEAPVASSRPAFDHARLAASTGRPADRLEIADIRGPALARRVDVRMPEGLVTCTLTTYRCGVAGTGTIPGGRSPDGTVHVIRTDQRLGMRWAEQPDEVTWLDLAPLDASVATRAEWAPGGQAVLVENSDRRHVTSAPLLAFVDDDGRPAPRLVPFTGGTRASPDAPALRFTVVLPTTGPGGENGGWRAVPVDLDAQAWSSAIAGGQTFWSRDGTRLFILLASRDGTALTLWQIDTASGAVAGAVEERAEGGLSWNLHWGGAPNVRVDAKSGHAVWFSERGGWGHLWRYTLDGSAPPRPLTSGAFVVRDLLWIDDTGTHMLVTVAGHDPSEDPYHRHLAHLDATSGRLRRLTALGADHAVSVSPSGRFFVDVASSLERETTMALHRADGSLVGVLETADVSRLRDIGWSWPVRERLTLDGVAGDVYATIMRPSSFDPTVRYPVIEFLYPIPDGAWAPIRLGDALLNRFTHAQAVAELGFVVVFMDAPGTGLRSRAFRAGSRGNLHAVGLDDRVRALHVLASRHPQMDLTRVGVYGNSGGANATVRAMLARPDAYHVGVASGGNQDLRFGGPWVERHHGLDAGPPEQESNAPLASRLEGTLLLVHGALDRVVHPAQTLALAQAFIDANRDVDVLLLPNRGHDVLNDPYFIRRLWDHFVEHLQYRRPPIYQVAPLPLWLR